MRGPTVYSVVARKIGGRTCWTHSHRALERLLGYVVRMQRSAWRGASHPGVPFVSIASTRTAGNSGRIVTVALTEGMPEARGHTWTAEDYAKRDAAMAALG
ncbi:MAG TPA: hypothetical protein VGP82_04755 [Ktedonobacterales bacterium]|nr:hypothetical protein [Ktedonobacterales bacterium]